MKRMMLIGPSQCGKTSLTQRLRGEAMRYQKTQAIVWSPETIDTPGSTSKTDASTAPYSPAPAKPMWWRWY
jgi:ethanolamine utilization protein EutP (predicted NTPase)